MGGNSFTLFVSPHMWGRVPWPGPASQGGYPCQGVPHLGYPPIRPDQGVPLLGIPLPGSIPFLGVPHLGCPQSDLAGGTPCWGGWYPPGRGYPPAGGTPGRGYPPARSDRGYLRYPPGQTWLEGYPLLGGGTPLQETDGVLDMPRSVCLLRSRRRTFLFW